MDRADTNSLSNNALAVVGIVFRLYFFITAPLGLFALAPLVQMPLMAGEFSLFRHWLKSMGH